MQDNPAIQSLHDLASVKYSGVPHDHPDFPSHAQSWRDMTQHMAANTFNLMEQHKIPHHPKLKGQYDRGMLTAPEYAQSLLGQIYNS